MTWKVEDDPEWSIRTLVTLARSGCSKAPSAAEGAVSCGRCDSCIASKALLLVYREREQLESDPGSGMEGA